MQGVHGAGVVSYAAQALCSNMIRYKQTLVPAVKVSALADNGHSFSSPIALYSPFLSLSLTVMVLLLLGV